MSHFEVSCSCQFQVRGAGRLGVRVAWDAYITHTCSAGELPHPDVVGQNRGAESETSIRTQDGRWLYDREIPEIV